MVEGAEGSAVVAAELRERLGCVYECTGSAGLGRVGGVQGILRASSRLVIPSYCPQLDQMVRSAPLPPLPRPQSNGVHFPGNMAFDAAGNGITYASIAAAGGPADQWDAMPTWAKVSGRVGTRATLREWISAL